MGHKRNRKNKKNKKSKYSDDSSSSSSSSDYSDSESSESYKNEKRISKTDSLDLLASLSFLVSKDIKKEEKKKDDIIEVALKEIKNSNSNLENEKNENIEKTETENVEKTENNETENNQNSPNLINNIPTPNKKTDLRKNILKNTILHHELYDEPPTYAVSRNNSIDSNESDVDFMGGKDSRSSSLSVVGDDSNSLLNPPKDIPTPNTSMSCLQVQPVNNLETIKVQNPPEYNDSNFTFSSQSIGEEDKQNYSPKSKTLNPPLLSPLHHQIIPQESSSSFESLEDNNQEYQSQTNLQSQPPQSIQSQPPQPIQQPPQPIQSQPPQQPQQQIIQPQHPSNQPMLHISINNTPTNSPAPTPYQLPIVSPTISYQNIISGNIPNVHAIINSTPITPITPIRSNKPININENNYNYQSPLPTPTPLQNNENMNKSYAQPHTPRFESSPKGDEGYNRNRILKPKRNIITYEDNDEYKDFINKAKEYVISKESVPGNKDLENKIKLLKSLKETYKKLKENGSDVNCILDTIEKLENEIQGYNINNKILLNENENVRILEEEYKTIKDTINDYYSMKIKKIEDEKDKRMKIEEEICIKEKEELLNRLRDECNGNYSNRKCSCPVGNHTDFCKILKSNKYRFVRSDSLEELKRTYREIEKFNEFSLLDPIDKEIKNKEALEYEEYKNKYTEEIIPSKCKQLLEYQNKKKLKISREYDRSINDNKTAKIRTLNEYERKYNIIKSRISSDNKLILHMPSFNPLPIKLSYRNNINSPKTPKSPVNLTQRQNPYNRYGKTYKQDNQLREEILEIIKTPNIVRNNTNNIKEKHNLSIQNNIISLELPPKPIKKSNITETSFDLSSTGSIYEKNEKDVMIYQDIVRTPITMKSHKSLSEKEPSTPSFLLSISDTNSNNSYNNDYISSNESQNQKEDNKIKRLSLKYNNRYENNETDDYLYTSPLIKILERRENIKNIPHPPSTSKTRSNIIRR